jgi:hypothetical protein
MVPANHKVSIGWQIVATFIIIANFWAYYRIRKLRKYLLYIFLPLIAVLILDRVYEVSSRRFSPWGDNGLAFGNPPIDIPFVIAVFALVVIIRVFDIYFVVKWSREHNRQYD